jgi:hypothetical protein
VTAALKSRAFFHSPCNDTRPLPAYHPYPCLTDIVSTEFRNGLSMSRVFVCSCFMTFSPAPSFFLTCLECALRVINVFVSLFSMILSSESSPPSPIFLHPLLWYSRLLGFAFATQGIPTLYFVGNWNWKYLKWHTGTTVT